MAAKMESRVAIRARVFIVLVLGMVAVLGILAMHRVCIGLAMTGQDRNARGDALQRHHSNRQREHDLPAPPCHVCESNQNELLRQQRPWTRTGATSSVRISAPSARRSRSAKIDMDQITGASARYHAWLALSAGVYRP